MASLRFKSDGTPYVDFRCQGKRFRPEFLTTRDAQKFLRLADVNPVEAYRFWQESIAEDGPILAAAESVSLKDKVKSFKENYCAKKSGATDMKRTMDQFFDFVIERARLSTGRKVEDVDIKAVTLDDVEGFQSHLSRRLENASVNRYFTTVKTFFKRMAKAQYVLINFAALVDNLRVETRMRDAWRTEDTAALIEKLCESKSDQVLVDIARSMEVSPFGPIDFARLKWRMIDLEAGQIDTYRLKGRGRREWPVPLVPGYRKVLMAIKKRHEGMGLGGPDDHVYLDRDSRPIKAGWVSKSLERARKAAGIDRVPYSSRHKIITYVASKTDRDTAAKFAGHASVKTTEKHYLGSMNEDFNKKVKEAFADHEGH